MVVNLHKRLLSVCPLDIILQQALKKSHPELGHNLIFSANTVTYLIQSSSTRLPSQSSRCLMSQTYSMKLQESVTTCGFFGLSSLDTLTLVADIASTEPFVTSLYCTKLHNRGPAKFFMSIDLLHMGNNRYVAFKQ